MGYQQLLLVLLTTIIVGIATIIGFNIFGDNVRQANHDAVKQDLAQIAANSQAWYNRPVVLGGGGNSFEEITFLEIAIPSGVLSVDRMSIANQNGVYLIGSRGKDEFMVQAFAASSSSGSSAGDTGKPGNNNGQGPINNPGLGPINNPGVGPGNNNPHVGSGNNQETATFEITISKGNFFISELD